MNFPLSVSNKVPNNILMQPELQGQYNLNKACSQWMSLYQALTAEALVYVLPGDEGLQDLPFVANLGCYLPHIKHEEVVLIANYSSEPRKNEDRMGWAFFNKFDYRLLQPPYKWEGEADLKWVRDSLYVGCVGSRSEHEAYRWMSRCFDMEVVEIELVDKKLYHLDCVFMPLTENKAIVNVHAMFPHDLRKLENVTEVIPVPKEYRYEGWTNSIRIGNTLFHAPASLPTRPFEELLNKHGFGLKVFDLSEFDKSGADLSCLVMHMNYQNRQ